MANTLHPRPISVSGKNSRLSNRKLEAPCTCLRVRPWWSSMLSLAIMLKLHWFHLLWICCTTLLACNKSATNRTDVVPSRSDAFAARNRNIYSRRVVNKCVCKLSRVVVLVCCRLSIKCTLRVCVCCSWQFQWNVFCLFVIRKLRDWERARTMCFVFFILSS